MQYIHIKNLAKYNPGYTDRNLIWCKIYFSMINASYDFENMDDIDKWRLIALIMLELQMKKPIPLDEHWLQKKISNNKRPISLTLKMLHNFVELVTLPEESVYPRIEKNRVDKSRIDGFVKPTIEDLKTYIKEKGYSVSADKFLAHYDSNGWKVGKNPMKDWKATLKTWSLNQFDKSDKKSEVINKRGHEEYKMPKDWKNES